MDSIYVPICAEEVNYLSCHLQLKFYHINNEAIGLVLLQVIIPMHYTQADIWSKWFSADGVHLYYIFGNIRSFSWRKPLARKHLHNSAVMWELFWSLDCQQLETLSCLRAGGRLPPYPGVHAPQTTESHKIYLNTFNDSFHSVIVAVDYIIYV